MIDLFTYFTYLSLLFSILFLTYKATPIKEIVQNKIDLTQSSKLSIYHYIALFLISIVVGFRNEVGTDWQGYKDVFENIAADIETYNTELFYYGINKIVINLGGGSEIMFFVVALISWYFIFKSVPRLILPLTLFFLFTDEIFFWSMNGVRQFVALSIFLYAIQFIINKKLIAYLLLILLAMQFHTSAGILLLLYFVPYHKLYNQKIWIIIFLFSTFLSNLPFLANVMQLIFISIAQHISFLSNYLGFFDRGQYESVDIALGLGFYFKIIINLFVIVFSKKVIKKNPQTIIYFILFFIGAIIFNLFYQYQPIARLNLYFLVTRCIVLALIIYYLWHIREYKLIAASVVSLYFILFLSAIYNSSNLCNPYNFSF